MTDPDTRLLKIYCIEAYRTKHGLTAPETMRLFDRYGVMDYLNSEVLQWQRMEDIVFYVEEFIEARS